MRSRQLPWAESRMDTRSGQRRSRALRRLAPRQRATSRPHCPARQARKDKALEFCVVHHPEFPVRQRARDAHWNRRRSQRREIGRHGKSARFLWASTSAGAEIAGEFLQHRDRPDPATLIGKGKLEEIAGAAASVSADLLLFDHDLTASQQRNIEKVVNARVIDRTQLILDIFARHARTREGQLQVELAQLEYLLPRLGGRGVEMS